MILIQIRQATKINSFPNFPDTIIRVVKQLLEADMHGNMSIAVQMACSKHPSYTSDVPSPFAANTGISVSELLSSLWYSKASIKVDYM